MKYILYSIGIIVLSVTYKALGELSMKYGVEWQITFVVGSILLLAYALYKADI